MKWAWLLVASAACAPAPPERLRNPRPISHVDDPEPSVLPAPLPPLPPRLPAGLVPAPAFDFSILAVDFHDELRWPLTPMNHPAMEPKFPIAQAFAQPGIGWLELCGSGITSRYGKDKELLSYLRGWCKAVDGDTDAACSNLVPLIKSTTPRLEAAVRNDLANILSQGHADKAEHFIRVHSIRDVGMLDLLAANYVEVGTTADALSINLSAIDSDDYASPATECIRWTKHIVLTGDKSSVLIKRIESLAKQPKNADPTCVREYAKLACWATDDCALYAHELGGGLFDYDLITDLEKWERFTEAGSWWSVGRTAILQLGSPHSTQLFSDEQLAGIAIAAMVNGQRLRPVCDDAEKSQVKDNEAMLRKHAAGAYLPYLDDLVAACFPPQID